MVITKPVTTFVHIPTHRLTLICESFSKCCDCVMFYFNVLVFCLYFLNLLCFELSGQSPSVCENEQDYTSYILILIRILINHITFL